MALLTVAQVREHVETDLSDAAVQRLLDDADAAIVARYGDHHAVNVTLSGGSRTLQLARPVDTTQPVVIDETTSGTTTILAADDYRIDHGGRTLVRLDDGTNRASRWGTTVGVAYAPAGGTARRERVLADLVQLAVQYRALTSETAGDWRGTLPNYQTERDRLLTELDDGPVLV